MSRNKDCCGNCFYYNGDVGDGMQFCDEKEIDVDENGYCYRHKRKLKEITLQKNGGINYVINR